jgi:heme/copper-type cytochrome/quinol oxidase subunit 2
MYILIFLFVAFCSCISNCTALFPESPLQLLSRHKNKELKIIIKIIIIIIIIIIDIFVVIVIYCFIFHYFGTKDVSVHNVTSVGRPGRRLLILGQEIFLFATAARPTSYPMGTEGILLRG